MRSKEAEEALLRLYHSVHILRFFRLKSIYILSHSSKEFMPKIIEVLTTRKRKSFFANFSILCGNADLYVLNQSYKNFLVLLQ